MDIKTVIRAASQRLGLEKKADTNNYYRPWGFNPDGSVRRPSGQAPGVQKPTQPLPERGYFAQSKPTNTAKAGLSRYEMNQAGQAVRGENSRNQQLAQTGYKVQQNVAKGQLASTGAGRVYQNGYVAKPVNTAESIAASRAGNQFAGAPIIETKWWNPTSWDGRGTPGVTPVWFKPWTWDGTGNTGINANTNVGVTVTSSKLKNPDKLTPQERAAEELSVRAAQHRINTGRAINLEGPKKFWQRNKMDIGNAYTPAVWGSYLADLSNLPVGHHINQKTNADEPDAAPPSVANIWQTDADGRKYRRITSEDLVADRENRARNLMGAFYGPETYDDSEEALYNDMLEQMSRMRNDTTYYKDGVWTPGARDYWLNDSRFQTAYNNMRNVKNYNRDAMLNAFFGDASQMYKDTAPFVPKQKPTGI